MLVRGGASLTASVDGTIEIPVGGSAGFTWSAGSTNSTKHIVGPMPMALGTVSFTLGGADRITFAVYSADDSSLNFYKRMDVPETGDTFNGKIVTAVYTGFEDLNQKSTSDLPWDSIRDDVESVRVVDSDISPASLALWFKDMGKLASCDLLQLNLSRCNSLYGTFWNCANIDRLDSISKWNVSHVSCLSDTFYGCKKLSSLDLDAWDTHSVSTLDGVFYDCSGLTDLRIGKWDTSNADGLYYSFFGCSSLKYLDIANWDTSSFLTLNGTFRECVSMTTIDLSSWNLSSCKSIRQAFYLCSSLTELDCSNWNTSNITDMSSAFFACRSITELDVSNWNLSKCIDLSGTFESCDHLTSLDVSKWDVSNCTTLWKTFQNCSSLSSLPIGKWVTNKVADIGCCFRDCGSLTELDLSGWNIENATAASECFKNTVNLRKIEFGKNWRWIGSDGLLCSPDAKYISGADGKWYAASGGAGYAPADIPSGKADTYYAVAPSTFAVYSADDGSLDFYNRAGKPVVGDTWQGKNVNGVYTGFETTSYNYDNSIPITDGLANTCSSPWYSVKNSIKQVSVIDSGIKASSLRCWFANMLNVETVDINKLELAAPIDCTWTFINCRKMTSALLPDGLTPSLMSNLFYACMKLTSDGLSMPNFDMSSCTRSFAAFLSCYSLTTIPGIENWNVHNVQDFRDMFANCENLTADLSLWDVSSSSSGLDLPRNFNPDAPGVILPKPWQPTAFAVFSADDGSLDFYKREYSKMPKVGNKFEGKTVTEVYTGFETRRFVDTSSDSGDWTSQQPDTPWWGRRLEISSANVVDTGIRPSSVDYWFYGMENLKAIAVANLDTSSCDDFKMTFGHCGQIETIDLSAWSTASLCNLNGTFLCCLSLSTLDIDGWDTSKVVSFHCLMFDCKKMDSIKMQKVVDNLSVTECANDFRYLFNDCEKLTTIDLSSWNISNVTDYMYMFFACHNLTLDCSNWNVRQDAWHESFNSYAPGVILPKKWQ